MTWRAARAWFDLVRVYNVPIPLCGMLAGAYAAPATPSWRLLLVCVGALLGTAFTQSFNDYEDATTDKVNASHRPIPSGRLSAKGVLLGGYLFFFVMAGLTALAEPMAVLAVVGMFLSIRKYSALKKITVLHHVLMPAALFFTPIYGSLVMHGKVLPLAWASAIAIFLGDINMNVIGAFKDLWDTSEKERVLPMVIGARPSIVVALVCALAGLGTQIAAVYFRWSSPSALFPIGLALLLTLWSRLRLYREPSPKVGYSALKAGRLAECFGFPALIAGVLPVDHALSLIGCLTLFALYAQTILPENILPEEASTTIDSGAS